MPRAISLDARPPAHEDWPMLFYVVSEGRANALGRLNLRDRSTYGLDWIVLYASTARQAVQQWRLYKAGTHPDQADLEVEAAQYRVAAAGCAPAWEAERAVIAGEAAERLRAVATDQEALRQAQADLATVRRDLRRIAGTVTPGRASSRSRRRRSALLRGPKRGESKTRATAKRRRGRP